MDRQLNTQNIHYPFGYCTNVHPGSSLDEALSQVERIATQVRANLVPEGVLPLGLWFSEAAAEELLTTKSPSWLGDWLNQRGFAVQSLNGFPQGDFHKPVVKHSVYEPTWTCGSRATYTQRLGQILDSILPTGRTGAISTLPLGWPHAPWHADDFSLAAEHLHSTARFLHRLRENRGREIVLAIEPEPGSVLDKAADVVKFFERFLFSGPDEEVARQHLAICHDVCHSSVMFESQSDALELYRSAGIRIGKVQISSAIHVPWDNVVSLPEDFSALLEQVKQFNEPKYLHQTSRCDSSGHFNSLCEDLPLALREWTSSGNHPRHPWRIHFHVPIFLDRFGLLETTRADISEVCNFLQHHRNDQVSGRHWFTGCYEVETYAWSLLPSNLAEKDLATGISRELNYLNMTVFSGL